MVLIFSFRFLLDISNCGINIFNIWINSFMFNLMFICLLVYDWIFLKCYIFVIGKDKFNLY